ncbi:unnamed protein product [Arctia plantaginis]|uniref:Sperm microtubule inner protein 1 C-terminal domain-containing protein n=1 Tax=Arctia plantaginis TaxID=874455 RepID=A0A8S1AAE0_ARCPL|nr:unnamed protein product [Arctia plantaginis]CAB3251116.1 unnamed protein product [Arctia plantaginis]
MTATPAFKTDALKRFTRRNTVWYQNNLKKVLEACKERHVRDIDTNIAMAEELEAILNEKVELPREIEPHLCEPFEDDSLMRPVAPEVLDILYRSTEKYATERYLKRRNHDSPEDKYVFRVVTSWDYGWQQKQSKQRARDFNRGRCAILRDTFYRKNNLKPDPPHYAQPSGSEFSTCSEYSCNFN